MKKILCIILLLLLGVSCFAGTLYFCRIGNGYVATYENVTLVKYEPSGIVLFNDKNGRQIIVPVHAQWLYIE